MSDIFSSAANAIGSATTSLNGFHITGGTSITNSTLGIPSDFSSVSSGMAGLTSTLGGVVSQATSAVSSAVSDVTSALHLGSLGFGGSTASSSGSVGNAVDFRVRLRAQPSSQSQVYGPQGSSNILGILYETNGMFFPYTPTISWNQAVEYDALHFVHSNQDYYAYKNTPSTQIDISGQWSLQNQREGEYMLASIHFLRTVSKMYFGQSNPTLAGMPPPVLFLSGYGDYMFNDLPVIVKSHSYTLDGNVDYVTVSVAGGKVRLPSLFNISLSLVVQHTPTAMRKQFDLDKFRTGELMRSKGWI
jgi:hypothetical protein